MAILSLYPVVLVEYGEIFSNVMLCQSCKSAISKVMKENVFLLKKDIFANFLEKLWWNFWTENLFTKLTKMVWISLGYGKNDKVLLFRLFSSTYFTVNRGKYEVKCVLT